MKKIISVSSFLVGMLISPFAYAEGSAVQDLTDQLVNVVGVALGVFLLALANRAIAVLEKKTGIELSEKQRNQINAAVEQGISFAEEQAHKAVKSRLGSTTLPPKIDVATQFVLDLVNSTDLKSLTKEQAQKLIEARLGFTRNGKAQVISLVPSLPQSSVSSGGAPSSASSEEYVLHKVNPWKSDSAEVQANSSEAPPVTSEQAASSSSNPK